MDKYARRRFKLADASQPAMQALIVAELQGFTKLTEAAVHRMDVVNLDSVRFRGVCAKMFEGYVAEAAKTNAPIAQAAVGGDTWVFSFDDARAALTFGTELLRLCASAVFDHGLAYLKPALTLASGRPKGADGRILDDQTIAAYRQSDGGYPFEFVVHSSALSEVKATPGFQLA